MFDFRIIDTTDGNQILDRSLKTPYNALTPLQMVEYLEMDSQLNYIVYFMEGKIMVYKFDTYVKEHLRYAWLSGNYTNDELINKYGDAYSLFCYNHGYEIEELPQFEIVNVVALSGGTVVTSTSCYRKDAQHYASYYRKIGYHSRVLTDDELEKLYKNIESENRKMKESMVYCQ